MPPSGAVGGRAAGALTQLLLCGDVGSAAAVQDRSRAGGRGAGEPGAPW
eukprot:COSAG02_NODE_26446_length_632_cov_26.971857_2_plen_48_part_01